MEAFYSKGPTITLLQQTKLLSSWMCWGGSLPGWACVSPTRKRPISSNPSTLIFSLKIQNNNVLSPILKAMQKVVPKPSYDERQFKKSRSSNKFAMIVITKLILLIANHTFSSRKMLNLWITQSNINKNLNVFLSKLGSQTLFKRPKMIFKKFPPKSLSN